MKRDIDYYIDLLRNLDNPVYNAIIFIILAYLILIVVNRYFLVPLKKAHHLEKKELENDNLKMLATFSEFDPNPIIRIDEYGEIRDLNRSAKDLFQVAAENHNNIQEIIPGIKINFKEEIANNASLQLDITRGSRHFAVNFYGIKSLNRAQIYFLDLTERTNKEIITQESEKKFRSLSFYLQDYLETERQRIGIELHDVIGQNLFLLKLKFDEASKNYEDFKENYTNIVNSLNSTISELRNIMFDLKPRNLDDFGLDYAVSKLSEHISISTKTIGNVEILGETRRFDTNIELYIFRIIQECLSNIIRHSKATDYTIQLSYSEDTIKIFITDNGIGFDTEKVKKDSKFGLLNISERIKALNGKMKINSSNEGTFILFEIPV